mmetsp:Transcript_27209/g.40410  ORF Transcript_27209/g.40410 Transcript_27209/m.40410 type:complete len:89 (+) Transcript_27209:118-384(+)
MEVDVFAPANSPVYACKAPNALYRIGSNSLRSTQAAHWRSIAARATLLFSPEEFTLAAAILIPEQFVFSVVSLLYVFPFVSQKDIQVG